MIESVAAKQTKQKNRHGQKATHHQTVEALNMKRLSAKNIPRPNTNLSCKRRSKIRLHHLRAQCHRAYDEKRIGTVTLIHN